MIQLDYRLDGSTRRPARSVANDIKLRPERIDDTST